MKRKITGIYKITSPSGRVYIGQAVDTCKRLRRYKLLDCKKQLKIYRSFQKYGVENHTFEVIEECSIDLLNERERYWQEYYDCVKTGLNCMLTDTKIKRKVLSEEMKLNISIAGKGRAFTEIHKNRISDSLRGKKKSKEHIEKIRILKTGFKYSEETKKMISINNTGEGNPRAKIVLDTYNGIYYSHAKEASKLLKINYSTLKSYLNGNSKNKTSLIYV